MNKVTLYQISEVARQAEVSLRTARFYVEKGLLVSSIRTSDGTRLYSDIDVNRLKLIRRLRNTGMSVKKIGNILHTDGLKDRESVAKHTLEILEIEAENTRKSISLLEQQNKERQEIVDLVKNCLVCDLETCPDDCPPKSHVIL